MSEKVHLENYNFTSSLTSSLCSLLTSSTLCDCTLICPDGQLSAHKVILAASSSFFSSVFSLHHQQHYVIYLRGIRTDQMQAVLSYVYQGATQLDQEDLPSFLAVAEDLKIQGLTRHGDKKEMFKSFKDTSIDGSSLKEIEMKRKEKCDEDKVGKVTPIEDTGKGFHELPISNDQKVKKMKISSTITSSQSDNTLENIKQVEENNSVKEASGRKASPGNIQVDVQKAGTNYDLLEGGEDSCLDNANMSIPLRPKLEDVFKEMKDDKIHHTLPNSEKLFPNQVIRSKPVFCPICKMKDGMNLSLKQHMKDKREVKCQNCSLYFSNCNTLRVHLDGRCKKMKSKTT